MPAFNQSRERQGSSDSPNPEVPPAPRSELDNSLASDPRQKHIQWASNTNPSPIYPHRHRSPPPPKPLLYPGKWGAVFTVPPLSRGRRLERGNAEPPRRRLEEWSEVDLEANMSSAQNDDKTAAIMETIVEDTKPPAYDAEVRPPAYTERPEPAATTSSTITATTTAVSFENATMTRFNPTRAPRIVERPSGSRNLTHCCNSIKALFFFLVLGAVVYGVAKALHGAQPGG